MEDKTIQFKKFSYIYNFFEFLIILSSIAIAVLMRFKNLYGSRFIWEDEYFVFFNEYPDRPFYILLYKIFSLFFGNEHHVFFYISSIIGLLTCILLFFFTKKVCDLTTAKHASIIYLLLGFPVYYSRNAYPHSLQTLLLLFTIYFLINFFNERKKSFYLFFSGVTSSLCLFTHQSSYVFIISILIILLLSPFKTKPTKTVPLFLSGLILAIIPFMIFYGIKPFLEGMYSYKKNILQYYFFTPNFSKIFFINVYKSFGGNFQYIIIILGLLYCLLKYNSHKTSKINIIFIFVIISHVLFFMFSRILKHTLYERHFLCFSPILAIFSASFISSIGNRFKYLNSIIIIFYIVFSFFNLNNFIESSFKINDILQFIYKNNINPIFIISRLDIDSEQTFKTPVFNDPDIKINWPEVKKLYFEKNAKYLITSGLGEYSLIGKNDPILKFIKPLMTWKHPYKFKLNNFSDSTQDFSLYSLSDIFVKNHYNP